MSSLKKKLLAYLLVVICALLLAPSQVELFVRDGWILLNKAGYQMHAAKVAAAYVKQKGSRGRKWKVVEAMLLGGKGPVLPDGLMLVLSPYDFQTIPAVNETVQVWINPTTAELSVGNKPVARVGDWYFQKVTPGRVLWRALMVAVLGVVGVGALRRMCRLADRKA